MGGTLTPRPFESGQSICVSHAVVPQAGEDSFAFLTNAQGGYLCVADGCGGLGSKRYTRMGDRTGAFLAAHLVTHEVEQRMGELFPLPDGQEAGQALCASLAEALSQKLCQFEAEHSAQQRVRIVGSMQRALPTTLCLSLLKKSETGLDCLFLWAGDSRGYLMDAQGLHQLTADHTHLHADAMESLYQDAPLSNVLNGEEGFFISGRRVRIQEPCMVLVATDGVYAYLQNPMELEWLVLSTLNAAQSMESWQKKLRAELEKLASDDSTLELAVYGYQSFEAMQESFATRREMLQKAYITPVRRHKANLDFARAKWQAYIQQYDWTERTGQGEPDWRV